MKTLLTRAAFGLLALLACALGGPALAAVDCTTTTTPNVAGTLANAQFELLQKLCAQALAPTPAAPLAYSSAAGSPFTLTSAWVKVTTTTAATRGLLIAPTPSATAFDIEWTSVTAGAAAPTDLYGAPVGYGETFPGGLPVGDVYLKSTTGQVAIVRVGS